MKTPSPVQALLDLQKAQIENTITAIDLWCRIEAIETALNFLDSHAKDAIANALEAAVQKKRTEREELQSTLSMLRTMRPELLSQQEH